LPVRQGSLWCLNLLEAPARSTADALRLFGKTSARFEADYRSAVRPVLERGLPTALCTIFNGAFQDPDYAARARVALMMFNDVILRVGRAGWRTQRVLLVTPAADREVNMFAVAVPNTRSRSARSGIQRCDDWPPPNVVAASVLTP
jgi:hypothetical protein